MTAVSGAVGGNTDGAFSALLGFTSISGLSMQTEAIPYREGGYHTSMHMLPGQQVFSPVTFQRGVTLGSKQHLNWWKKIFDPGYGATAGSGDGPGSFRSMVQISILNHPQPLDADTTLYTGADGNPTNTGSYTTDPVAARVTLSNAWPTNLAYADLNAGDNGIWVEQMTLVHEGMAIDIASTPSETNLQNGTLPSLENAWA
jgi:phage tail-like protein